jgi:DNA-directed RNA polymerase subunit RPC12/RpoP
MTIYYKPIEIKANQHMFSAILYKVYNMQKTYKCPKCKSNVKVRYNRKDEGINWFLSKCENLEAQRESDRACNGRYMKCPHCGEKLLLDRARIGWKLKPTN